MNPIDLHEIITFAITTLFGLIIRFFEKKKIVQTHESIVKDLKNTVDNLTMRK